jgi:GNAT superfamily N-acetyltransferase
MDISIRSATTSQDIAACYEVMRQLRPHLTPETFLARVQQQAVQGYQLVGASVDGIVVGVAGYRLLASLSWGKFLYVDDLVTDQAWRSQGVGKALLDWLTAEAGRLGCDELHLDSGVQRLDAHRFYDREGMQRTAYHFAIKLPR